MAANHGTTIEFGGIRTGEHELWHTDTHALPLSLNPPEHPPTSTRIWDLIEKAHRLQNGAWNEQIDAARELLTDLVREADGQGFVYQIVHSPHLPPASCSAANITDERAELAGFHPGKNYRVHQDPVARHALRTVRPFFWRDLPHTPHRADALGAVMTVPIHHGPEVATLSIAPGPGRTARLTAHTHLLCLLTHLVHTRIHRALVEVALSVSPRRRSLLSPRETEVLNHVARGKSTSEISAELALSTKGVEFHIDGAKRKLNVSNRTHAVAKAIALGLITYGHDERARP